MNTVQGLKERKHPTCTITRAENGYIVTFSLWSGDFEAKNYTCANLNEVAEQVKAGFQREDGVTRD